jgi:hypothetical protein
MKTTLKNIIGVAAIVLATVISTGCATQNKSTVQREPVAVDVVQTDNGTTVYPSSYYSVTNASGQVMTFPQYSAVINTNKAPFSLKSFLWGGDHSLMAFTDRPYETHTGNGKALLVDWKYNQLTSDFASGSRFAGTSQLSVGSIDLEVNTNAITATGNAGNSLLQGLGSAVGDIISNAKK